MNGVSVTVVMPAYNEQDGIHTAVAAVQTHILDKVPGAELLIVNDGSRDNTAAIVDAIVAADARVRALHTPNGGHGTALAGGNAGGDFRQFARCLIGQAIFAQIQRANKGAVDDQIRIAADG